MTHLQRSFTLLISLAILLFIQSCGGGSDHNNSGASPNITSTNQVASVEIIPGGAMLTTEGEQRQLTARVLDQQGNQVNAPVTWSSESSDVISVDLSGKLTALASIGSSKIIATAGGVNSTPVLAFVATPVAGAILVSDSQVATSRAPVVASATELLGRRYVVNLRDIAAPPVGAIVLGKESAPVAGKVVAVSPATGFVSVTLEVVPVDEMFEHLVVKMSHQMTAADIRLDETLQNDYNVQISPDGEIALTPKDPNAAPASKTTKADAVPSLEKVEKAGFTCEASTPVKLSGFSAAPKLKLVPPFFELDYNRDDASLKKLAFTGAELQGSLKAAASLLPTGKGGFDCRKRIGAIPAPLTGPLTLIVGSEIEFGVGLGAAWGVTIGAIEISPEVSFGLKNIGFGVACNKGVTSCEGIKSATPTAEGKFPVSLPNIESIAALARVEPEGAAYGYAKWTVGGNSLVKSFFGDTLSLTAAEATGGFEFKSSYMTIRAQMADANYVSEYKVNAAMKVESKAGLESLGKLFKLEFLKFSSAVELQIARSAQAEGLKADTQTLQIGKTTNFSVDMKKDTLKFLGLNNIVGIDLYRIDTGRLIGSIPANSATSHYEFSYSPDKEGPIAGNVYAFARPTNLIFFDILAVELGSFNPGTGVPPPQSTGAASIKLSNISCSPISDEKQRKTISLTVTSTYPRAWVYFNFPYMQYDALENFSCGSWEGSTIALPYKITPPGTIQPICRRNGPNAPATTTISYQVIAGYNEQSRKDGTNDINDEDDFEFSYFDDKIFDQVFPSNLPDTVHCLKGLYRTRPAN